MDYLPIFCRLDNKPVLLVGGGEVAERKARLLLDAGAQLTVVAPDLDPELAELAANGTIEWLDAEFAPAHLTGKWLAPIWRGSLPTWWITRNAPASSCRRSSIARR